MQTTEFIWMNGEFIPWEKANVHVLTHALHYGGGVFEGIRFYETEDGGSAIFRLREHITRFFFSASVIRLKIPFSQDQLIEAIIELVRKNNIKQGYIRPLAYYGYGKMGLKPIGAPAYVAIALWPWGAYLSQEIIKVKTSSIRRIHPLTTNPRAKIAGLYANSILASLDVHEQGYDEALLIDCYGNVAEGPGENIFMVKNNVLITPAEGALLPGITRDSIITIGHDLGYEVQEKVLHVEDFYEADEAFLTGTAVEVSPIGSLDDRTIGDGTMGEMTGKLQQTYRDLVKDKFDRYRQWITHI